jgi:hypothetical protein
MGIPENMAPGTGGAGSAAQNRPGRQGTGESVRQAYPKAERRLAGKNRLPEKIVAVPFPYTPW